MTTTTQKSENKPCVFCTNPDNRKRMIFENELVWAFPTNIPITPGHTLVVPQRCIANLGDATPAEGLAILDAAERIKEALRKAYGAEGFNVAWNEGKLAGQSALHFHLHIIPRKEGDTGLMGYDPRSNLYRTGDREPSDESELQKVRDIIKGSL